MPRYFPAAILLVSLVLRFALAAQGGQYFFGDEPRYDRGIDLYRAVTSGDLSAAADIAAMPEHALFPVVGAFVTAVQHLLAHLTPFGDWSHSEYVGFTIWIGAAVLSVFSTLNLALLYRLARLAGASAEESAWALLLMAAANSAFYYSRHLLPYDCALSAALGALVIGFGSSAPTLRRAVLAGLLTGCCYHLYNGYWFLVPVTGLLLAVAWRNSPQCLRLALASSLGLVVALGLPVALGTALGGAKYWATLRAFSGTVTQGLFAEGWSLPWEYLWHAEGPFGLAIAILIVATLIRAIRAEDPLPDRVRLTLLAVAAIWVTLTLFSTILGRFVVYGRTVKPLLPALCLLGGWALAQALAPRPVFKPFVTLAVLVFAGLSFAPHFTRVFPRETELAILRDWGNPKRALTLSGSIYIPLDLPVKRPNLALVNAQVLYPVRAAIPAPAGHTLLRLTHPLAYPPFQYEGHTPRERALLRSTDLSMRLIELDRPASVPDHPPPAMRYQNSDRPTGR